MNLNLSININEKFNLISNVIEDLPIEYIRQIKINYDCKYISIILLEILDNNLYYKQKIFIFNELKYNNYKIEDLYYLISKLSNTINKYKIASYPNLHKDGFNVYVNTKYMFNIYEKNKYITIDFI